MFVRVVLWLFDVDVVLLLCVFLGDDESGNVCWVGDCWFMLILWLVGFELGVVIKVLFCEMLWGSEGGGILDLLVLENVCFCCFLGIFERGVVSIVLLRLLVVVFLLLVVVVWLWCLFFVFWLLWLDIELYILVFLGKLVVLMMWDVLEVVDF